MAPGTFSMSERSSASRASRLSSARWRRRAIDLGWRAMDIEGSGALVVGGASGLGEATARRLHAQGAALTIADVNAEKGQALADELGAAFAACDVREEDQVEAAVAAAAGADAALRICVNCAGTGFAQKTPAPRGPPAREPFAVIIAINLIGTFNVLRFAATA